jgi:hypothetical protein
MLKILPPNTRLNGFYPTANADLTFDESLELTTEAVIEKPQSQNLQ